MALDLLLVPGGSSDMEAACLRGYWPPLPLRPLQAPSLTHLAVLAPDAKAVEVVAPIEHLLLWYEQDGRFWWLPLLGRLRRLRRAIAAGCSRELERWRPRSAEDVRLLSIDALLVCDSLADYLQRRRRKGEWLDLNPDPEPPPAAPQAGDPPTRGPRRGGQRR